MSDYCHLEIIACKSSLPKMDQAFEEYRGEYGDPLNYIIVEEASHGMLEELANSARNGAVFTAWHTAGAGFGARSYVGLGNDLYGANHSLNGRPYVEVNPQGEPDPCQLQSAREFIKAHARATALINAEDGEVEE